jgi:hypothetical protein
MDHSTPSPLGWGKLNFLWIPQTQQNLQYSPSHKPSDAIQDCAQCPHMLDFPEGRRIVCQWVEGLSRLCKVSEVLVRHDPTIGNIDSSSSSEMTYSIGESFYALIEGKRRSRFTKKNKINCLVLFVHLYCKCFTSWLSYPTRSYTT